jgi:hypothetical protein
VDVDRLLLPFSKGSQEFTDVAVYNAILRQHAESRDKRRVGDKDPRGIEYLPLVHRHWPESFIVHVVRDPRDVLASKKRAEWSKRKPSFLHIFANRVQFRLGRENGPRLFGERYQEIFYEQLISNPEVVLKNACRKLGLVFEPGMLEFSSTAKSLVSQSEMSWKKETLGPLLGNNWGHWKTTLTPWEVALTETACGETFEIGGYVRSNWISRLPVHKRVGIFFTTRALEIMDWTYRKYRLWTIH